jgi:predicted RNA-binding Zn-ribbon protein involved in translation (DUF1610 family)
MKEIKYKQIIKSLQEDRNRQIMDMYKEGASFGKISKVFDISRQRVSQILINKLGGSTGRMEERSKRASERRREIENSVKFKCKNCGKQILRKDAKHRSVFCSTECANKYNGVSRRGTEICAYCKQPYSPFRTSKYIDRKSKSGFCCREHYFSYKREHPEIYKRNIRRNQEIIQMKQSGMTVEQLSEKFGLSIPSIYIITRNTNIDNK